jgi:hypothetical protein
MEVYSPVQQFHLYRLDRAIRLYHEWYEKLGPRSWQMSLINRSIFSFYLSCRDAGLTIEAQALLQHLPRPQVTQVA